VDNALQTDFLGLRAEATLGLAQVLIARGRAGEARSEARAALELFRAKGDRPGSEAAQELLASEVN
jgi:hypothetical protein